MNWGMFMNYHTRVICCLLPGCVRMSGFMCIMLIWSEDICGGPMEDTSSLTFSKALPGKVYPKYLTFLIYSCEAWSLQNNSL